MRLKLFLGLLALMGIVGGGYYYFKVYRQQNGYEVTKPVRGPAVLAVYATGTVEASVTIPVASRHPGRLMQLAVDEGQTVKKGMLMAQLEDEDLQNAVNERQANLDLAQKEYDRQLRLVNSGAVSKQALDKAQAALETAKASLAQAVANLDDMKLLAPEDGLVIRRDGEIGEMIAANQSILWMSCCSGLRISVEVDEEDIPLVQPGQAVVIHADAYPNDVFNGKVQSITPKGDPVARSYRVRIGLDSDSKLMIGMTAETNIIIGEEKNALLVPATSISGGSVFVIKDGKADKINVETGARGDNKVEIRKGITDNDLVIVQPDEKLKDDQTVLIKTTSGKP